MDLRHIFVCFNDDSLEFIWINYITNWLIDLWMNELLYLNSLLINLIVLLFVYLVIWLIIQWINELGKLMSVCTKCSLMVPLWL